MHSAYPPAPNIDELSFILVTKCKRVSYKFLNITDLVEDPLFVSANTTYMFVPGWLDSGNFSEVGDVLTKAFLCHGDNNFIVSRTKKLGECSTRISLFSETYDNGLIR